MKKLNTVFLVLFVLLATGCTSTMSPESILPTLSAFVLPDLNKENPATQTPNAGNALEGASVPPTAMPIPVMVPEVQQPPCNLAAAGQPFDITIPDASEVKTNESFVKTWRLINMGSCTWNQDYGLVWFSADRLGAAELQSMTGEVKPGESIDISVDMVAPGVPGNYQSFWKLQAPDGELFGIGPAGDGAFWVEINVIADGETPTAELALTATPEPIVMVEGSGNIILNIQYDLDTGMAVNGDASDIEYMIGDNSLHYIKPVNGTRLVVYGVVTPTVHGCEGASLTADAVAIETLTGDTYLCYQTNSGLPGYLRASLTEGDQLTFIFLTWAVP